MWLVVLGLGGCATTSRDSVSLDPAWHLNGKLGVVSRDRRGSFGLDWQQFEGGYEIDLLGPLGMGVARVRRAGNQVTLEMPGEAPITATNADELLYRATGLAIPVTPMRHWVLGEPAPGRFRARDDGFRQYGWDIAYQRFEDGLPMRMTVSRAEARLTLIVRRWEVRP
ncbi:MAG: lipoprotein insertase outer membrane protein LolB [Gammaproteobacteria bacterium]|nr:lipoprotein insertase outer membrane protein LolB [Gammaproteobacteria bacterium]